MAVNRSKLSSGLVRARPRSWGPAAILAGAAILFGALAVVEVLSLQTDAGTGWWGRGILAAGSGATAAIAAYLGCHFLIMVGAVPLAIWRIRDGELWIGSCWGRAGFERRGLRGRSTPSFEHAKSRPPVAALAVEVTSLLLSFGGRRLELRTYGIVPEGAIAELVKQVRSALAANWNG